MPYTPPSQRSPVASRSESPSLCRSQSYFEGQQHLNSTLNTSSRPNLPRSASSTAYLHKHRRSPSLTKSTTFTGPASPETSPSSGESVGLEGADISTQISSLHKSPPPVEKFSILADAGLSPPDSNQNSSDDEDQSRRGRARELENLAELRAAIRIIEQHRESSPNRVSEATKKAKHALGLIVPSLRPTEVQHGHSLRPPLSQEARKISHSRSNTESVALELSKRHCMDSPGRSTSGSDHDDADDDGDPPQKPSMVRKKSGELVRPALRPSLGKRRPSSMPGTPTYSKAVHFDKHLEHVRHFLQVDRPLAVSASSSPVENYENEVEFPFGGANSQEEGTIVEYEIRLANFPRETVERMSMAVRVEKVFLSPDNKNLIGCVAVQNLAFHKLVVARFTFDYWKTTSEVVAEFDNDVRRKQRNDGLDRFNFSIKVEDQANLERKTLFFCVRYNVNGQEFWDSNNNMNFQVDFVKKEKPLAAKQGVSGPGARSLPHSRRNPRTSSDRPRSMPSSFDDFAEGFESRYEFGAFVQPKVEVLGESPIRLKNSKATATFVPDAPNRRSNAPTQAFGNRYDFGASLSAAIQAASNNTGERNGNQNQDEILSPLSSKPSALAHHLGPSSTPSRLQNSASCPLKKTSAVPGEKKASPIADTPKPDALTSTKPTLQSQSYHELLDKYCFVRTRLARETQG